MKIAVGLFGLHYAESIQHWKHYFQSVNYRLTYQNQKQYLYTAFRDSSCDFYSATYFSPILSTLIKDFNFSGLRLLQPNYNLALNGPLFARRNLVFRQTLQLILDQPVEYDYVLITRYDLKFHLKLNTLNFDLNKLNILGQAEWTPGVITCDDNFYFLPFSKLKEFNQLVRSIPINLSAHGWNKHFTDVHYILPDFYKGPIPSDIYSVVRHNVARIPMPVMN